MKSCHWLAGQIFVSVLALLFAPLLRADMPAPESAVVLDLHRPWLDGANWDSNTPPAVYGVDTTGDAPHFSIVDPNAQSLWVYRLALPVDLTKYPIVVIKYRAKNTNPDSTRLLRLVAEKDGVKSRVDAFKGSDLVSDGQVHEIQQDLRDVGGDGSLSNFAFGFRTADSAASVDLLEVRFTAPTPVDKLKEQPALRVHVTDQNDAPLAGVKVTIDSERANFARSAQTNAAGDVSLTPLTNECDKHMLRVEKEGYLTLEYPNTVNESGQGVLVKTMPAARFGGVAKEANGTPAAMAQVSIKFKPGLLEQIPTRFQTNIVTNEKGEWKSPPLPADASQLLVSLTTRDGVGQSATTQLDAANFQLTASGKQPFLAAASAKPASKDAAAKPAPAAPNDATAVAPDQAVVLDLHHPWVDASKWERNTAPVVYGIDMTRNNPRIDLRDANSKTMWALRLSIPVDAKQYPLITFKYRAKNTGSKTAYVLRLVHGAQDNRQVVKFFAAADLQADGEVHELTADLREKQIKDDVVEAAVGLWSDDKPAWIDVIGISFSAAPDTQIAQKFGEDPEIKIHVADTDGNPVGGARVTVDAERVNFARAAETNEKGDVSIKPSSNESHAHMARVEKKGYVTIDHAIEGNSSEFKTAPAVVYGGLAIGESGQGSANAQIVIRLKNAFLRDAGLMNYPVVVTTTDDKGHWSAPPLPSDASLVTIQSREPASQAGGEPVVSAMEAEKFQLPNEPWPAFFVADSAPVAPTVSHETKPEAAKPVATAATAPAAKPAAPKPNIEPIVATVQKVDDSTTGIGWVGVEDDNIVAIVHPQPGTDQTIKIPLTDVTEMTLKRGASYTPPATLPSTRPTDTLPSARAVLADYDRLSGTIIGWSDKKLSIQPAATTSSTIEIPVSSLRELWCGTANDIKKAQALKEQVGLDDIAFAKKDDDVIAVHGIVIGISDDSLHFRFDNADRKIGLNRLVGIMMAKSEEKPADDALYEQVQLVTDDQISGKLGAVDGKDLVMQSRAGASIHLPVDKIARIVTRNGRLTYLSDVKPTKVEQTPYFDRMLEYQVDKALNGKPIVMSDGTYAHGISVHSRTVLTYNLDGKFSEFKSKVGFQLPEGKVGDCAIRVLADGKPLFDKPDALGTQPPADLKLKVDGVRELTLEVDFGRNDDVGDRVVWANARLLRAEK
jgi:hypothetical protein